MGCSSSQQVTDPPVSDVQKKKPKFLRVITPRFIAVPVSYLVNAVRHPDSMFRHSSQAGTGTANDSDNGNPIDTSRYALQNARFEASRTLQFANNEVVSAGNMSDATLGDPPVAAASQRPPTLPSSQCNFCLEDMSKDGTVILKPCRKCNAQCCGTCIRKMFLDACKNEANMPPRCCAPIPLAFGRKVLSAEEVTLFKEKYEEWSTSNRVYCPVPTCSAFIPNRLFPAPVESVPDVKAGNAFTEKRRNSTVTFATGVKMEIHTPAPPPCSSTATTSSIPCPKCAVQICCSCKQLSHPGSPCAEVQDIDPELADLLKRWGIRRCPKCRAAVRRMYGCNHIQCRCGAQWCWFCTGPIANCRDLPCPAEMEGEDFERQINDENDERVQGTAGGGGSDENEPARQQPANGDGAQTDMPASDPARLVNLDAGWHWEGAGVDFGDEPNAMELDPFDCHHAWISVEQSEIEPDLEYECERCWRKVYPMSGSYRYIGMIDLVESDSINAQSATGTATFSKDALMHRCDECGVIRCAGCTKETTR